MGSMHQGRLLRLLAGRMYVGLVAAGVFEGIVTTMSALSGREETFLTIGRERPPRC